MSNIDRTGSGTLESAMAKPTGRRGSRRRVLGAVAVVLVLVSSAMVIWGLPGASASPLGGSLGTTTSAHAKATAKAGASAVGAVTPSSSSTSGVRLTPHPKSSPVASGRGTFFESSNLSQATVGNLSCQKPYYTTTVTCENTTFDPSINVTSSGVIAVAFTATTDFTNCPGVANISNNTTMDVAVQTSTNGGLTWGSPVYLGNTNCSAAENFSEAWQPSLTSLSNGTLVVSYVMFSDYICPYYYCSQSLAPNYWPYQIIHDDLVVQESYNGGTTWTTPQVINSTYNAGAAAGTYCALGWPAYRPAIAASGNSLYLAWENLTDANGCSFSQPYSAGINFVSSSNGGANWSAPVEFPSIGDGGHPIYGSESTNFSVNPFVLAASNGQVYVAYATGFAYQSGICQPTGCLPYSIYTDDVVVANATGGTGNWTVHTAATSVPFNLYGHYYSPFSGLSPQVGYNGLNGQLYVVYNGLLIGSFCYTSGTYHYCYTNTYEQVADFQNSSNGGANWSGAVEVGNSVNPYGGPENFEEYPSLVVDHNGTAHVALQYYNETLCTIIGTYLYCGEYVQQYYNTTDNGSSWSGPVIISPFYIPPTDYAYLGEYETAAVAPSGTAYFAWVNSQCPTSSSTAYYYCQYSYTPTSVTNVTVSWLYRGPGVALTFHETNLTSAGSWSAEVLGNYRAAPAGTDLVVSGAPPTEKLFWTVPWVNLTYGLTWESIPGSSNPVPPAAFAANTTLTFTFAEYVLLDVFVIPPINTFYLTAGLNEATYSMTPLPGQYWLPVNSTTTLTVAPQAISCTSFCFYYNLTWVSWTGTGVGSASTNLTSITVTVGSTPVNETANFLFLGYCEGFSGTLYCYNAYGYPLTFHETGLPTGTSWGATVVVNSTANGTESASSTNQWLNESTGQTAVQYTVWTVPDGSTGNYWVPTTDPASPVKEPAQTLVNVTYTLMSPSSATFWANFTAIGLPNGTTWSANVGSASYAVTEGNLSVAVPGGLALNLTGAPVYTEGGVGYYASSVAVFPYVMNTTWQNTTTLPDAYTFDGSAHVFVTYSPEFWLTVSASAGGNVTPSSQWVPTGNAVALTATPSTGYHFLDWASVGAGGTTVAQEHNASTTIHPSAPVSEFATFRQDPAPTWNVTVTAMGLPATTGFTFTLGGTTYTGAGGVLKIGNLTGGPYGFSTAIAYANGTDGTRWVPTSWTTSYAAVGGLLTIGTNGTIQVNYTTQYVLTVASTPDGTVTSSVSVPAVGSTWQSAGTMATLTATPSFHYKFGGWNASGSGAESGMSPQITVTLEGPVWESASFVYRVFPPPALYWLNVTETGLPSGVSWNISAGTGNASAAGATPSLTLTGLNGTYTLVVPAVYTGLGTRYVASSLAAVPVTSNGSQSVAFSEEFAFTVSASLGGTVTGAGTSWVAPGASETLSATPSANYQFVSWNGTGTGNAQPYTGTLANGQSLTVNGPTNETASFEPVVHKQVTGSATAGQVPALGILAALLVVGLVVGLIVGSRRGGKPSAPASGEGSESEPAAGPDDTYGSGGSGPSEGASGAPAMEYDESTP